MSSREDVLSSARRIYDQGPWLRRTLQQYRPHICPFEELIDRVPAGSQVLDVGCGSGLFLMLLAASGRLGKGVGFDVQPQAIAYASDTLKRSDLHADIDFVLADSGFEWPVGRFDVVSIIDVMHHVPPAEQLPFLQRAIRAVRPGGMLLYKDIGHRPHWRAFGNRLHDIVLARQWIHYLPIGEVIRCAERAGMQLVEAAKHNMWWYGHELAVFRFDNSGSHDQ